MESPFDVIRRRLETQGFRGLTDEQIRQLDPWIRFTPFVNALMAGLAALRVSAGLFAFVGVMALLGAAMPRHPFDIFYNRAIRMLEDSPPLPRSSRRRRTVFVVVALLAFSASGLIYSGNSNTGVALGVGLAALQGFVAAHQLCVVSETIQRLRNFFTR